jgi:aspartyl-tRNA(Asn)/glutamyl-tRNA(Gln) amidotransferase subunit A
MPEKDPLADGGLAEFARNFRSGAISSVQATEGYLARIEALNPRLEAYEHIAADQALATAHAMDALRAAGTDLGPLMGVPIAVKDLISVEGMPTRAGTRLDVADLIGPEGPVIKALRRAGCIILGKTKTVEFALGITGLSQPRGTPVNPWDAGTVRLPGGSSSGSAVATAAGLCAFALGSDTGGSVRVPAALNGVFGLKTSFGRLSNEGAFPLARHLDTIGLLTRSAHDAAIAFSELMGHALPAPAKLDHLRLARPDNYFFERLDPELGSRVEAGLAQMQAAGALIEGLLIPEAPEREAYFPVVLPVCLLADLGRERFLAGRGMIDPVIERRIAAALEIAASDYVALERRREASVKRALQRFEGFDAWISPTTAIYPPAVESLADEQTAFDLALGMTRNTQPANYLNLCAVSIPLPMDGHAFPAGLQVMCPSGKEEQLLAIAIGIEALLGLPQLPETEKLLVCSPPRSPATS